MPPDAIDHWIESGVAELDPSTFEVATGAERFAELEAAMSRGRVVLLGETNHFVHEKVEFRLWWLRRVSPLR